MNVKELRKQFPAPYALSVLKRALELNPYRPEMEIAIAEYAEKMKKRPTRYDFHIIMNSGINQLTIGKVSAETEKYRPIYKALCVLERNGNLQQKTVEEIMAIYGEHIEVHHPAKSFTLKGAINGFYEVSHYIGIIGIDVIPAINKVELTLKEEIRATLVKNVIYHYMEYAYQCEKREKEISHLTEITEWKHEAKLLHRLETLKQEKQNMPPFIEFFLEQKIAVYDSIMKKPGYFFQEEDRTMRYYLKQAAKKQAEAIGVPQLEITIMQAEMHDLAK